MSSQGVVLIVGGGIAAYKSLELIRLLRGRGIGVTVILTKAGSEFVTPLSLATLSGAPVREALFDPARESEIGHIELSRSADLVVVAPATADLMARMAQGHANDLATTALLATDKPVLLAPAMNVRMWLHAATQRNLAQLIADGVHVVGPHDGIMACHETGPGRMAEPAEILDAILGLLAPAAQPLKGRHVLVTAGPTHEAIDPVRYIANRSSGKQGYAIAEAARNLGARVTLISGPVAIAAPGGVTRVMVESARQMMAAAQAALPADIGVFTAAVADWRVVTEASSKIKKGADGVPSLALAENPDILKTIGTAAKRPAVVCGFAAETDDPVGHAQKKLFSKGADLIIANDVRPGTGVMGGERNRVHLVSASGVESWPEMSKREVAVKLMTHLASLLA